MLIRHDSDGDTLTYEGRVYHAGDNHTFDVPEPVGLELLSRAGWSEYTGEPEADDAPAADHDELESLKARVAELEEELAHSNAHRARAKRAAAPKGD